MKLYASFLLFFAFFFLLGVTDTQAIDIPNRPANLSFNATFLNNNTEFLSISLNHNDRWACFGGYPPLGSQLGVCENVTSGSLGLGANQTVASVDFQKFFNASDSSMTSFVNGTIIRVKSKGGFNIAEGTEYFRSEQTGDVIYVKSRGTTRGYFYFPARVVRADNTIQDFHWFHQADFTYDVWFPDPSNVVFFPEPNRSKNFTFNTDLSTIEDVRFLTPNGNIRTVSAVFSGSVPRFDTQYNRGGVVNNSRGSIAFSVTQLNPMPSDITDIFLTENVDHFHEGTIIRFSEAVVGGSGTAYFRVKLLADVQRGTTGRADGTGDFLWAPADIIRYDEASQPSWSGVTSFSVDVWSARNVTLPAGRVYNTSAWYVYIFGEDRKQDFTFWQLWFWRLILAGLFISGLLVARYFSMNNENFIVRYVAVVGGVAVTLIMFIFIIQFEDIHGSVFFKLIWLILLLVTCGLFLGGWDLARGKR